jgi:hypothetical protein
MANKTPKSASAAQKSDEPAVESDVDVASAAQKSDEPAVEQAEARVWRRVEAIISDLLSVRENLLEIHAFIEGCRADGPVDATAPAGMLAGVLLQAGGGLHVGDGHELRWLLEAPTPAQKAADPDGNLATRALVDYLLCSIEHGRHHPDLRKERLQRIAQLWPECRTKADADADEAEAHRDEIADKDAREQEAHQKRIGEKHRADIAARSLARPAPPVQSRPDGEFEENEAPRVS